MSIDATMTTMLDAGRRAALAKMTDRCRITTPGTPGALNEETGRHTMTPGATLYEGQCWVQAQPRTATPDVGGTEWSVDDLNVLVPVETTAGIYVDCLVHITYARLDPALADVNLRVTAAPHESHAVARTLVCQEVTR